MIRHKLVLCLLLFSCLWMLFGQVGGLVFADQLPDDEITALDDYTHWVSGVGACGSAGDPASSGVAAASGPVFILGDSIALRAKTQYQRSFQAAGVTATVDASSSRSLNGKGIDGNRLSGMEAIAQDTTDIKAAANIVVALGTNGGNTPASLKKAVDALRAVNATAPIFWVDTISVGRADNYNSTTIKPANEAIYGEAATLKYTVIPWFKTVDPAGNPQAPTKAEADPNGLIDGTENPNLGVHPTPKGARTLADLVVAATKGAAGGGASTPAAAAASITINGPFLPKAVPGDTIHKGDAYKGNASTYGNDPATGFIDPGDVGPNGQPLKPALAGATNAQPAIAVYNHGSLGGWWKVIAPNSKAAILQQTDIGPSTPRITDINSAAAKAVFGYPQGNSFPTDQGEWKIEYMGKIKPPGAIASVADAAGGTATPTAAAACCPPDQGGQSTVLTGTSNKEKIWNFLVQDMKLTNVQAAGIMGNMQQESGFSPTALNSRSGAFGIAQWFAGRHTALQNFAAAQGKPIGDLGMQLDFLKKELSAAPYDTAVLGPIKGSSSLPTVVRIWLEHYEIPCSPPGHACDAEVATRLPFAQKILDDLGGGGAPANGAPAPVGAAGCAGGATAATTGYKNPLRDVKPLGISRIDMGVDYFGKGPVYAIGTAKITHVSKGNSSFWGCCGGDSVVYTLADGPAAGKSIYFAEECPPAAVKPGDNVTADTVICNMDGTRSIETGWAKGDGSDTAAAYTVYNEGDVTAYGVNFNEFLVKLGAHGGTGNTANPVGKLPAGWPQWN